MSKNRVRRIAYAALLLTLCTPSFAAASHCTGLASLSLAKTEITSAAEVTSGQFTAPASVESASAPESPRSVPSFCRVQGIARPTEDSLIHFEVWLPAPSRWNGQFEGVGNGGYLGSISYGAMENAVRRGFATASTDTGHVGSNLAFAAGHPEKIADWGYRAVHVTAEAAKLTLRAYYGRFPQYSLFNGCSTGGGQALSEAQRYPDDYDGILAGDAGNNRVHLNVAFLWAYAATHQDGKLLLPESKLPLINKAAIAACDMNDGVVDGIIGNPAACHFDPKVLACHADQSVSCLSPAQIEAVRKIYAGPTNPRTGEHIMAGWAPGSEVLTTGDYAGWKNYILSGAEPARTDFWKYFVFEDPHWDWRTFDYDRDVTFADRKLAAVNASDADLSRFKARGGKLLMYHGWVDPVGPPQDAIGYYLDVERHMGGPAATQDFFRLFLVPGMSHCNGGPGYQLAGGARAGNDPDNVPNSSLIDPAHDSLSALERWVETGTPPAEIIATRQLSPTEQRTIPVCPYPSVAQLTRGGNPDNASGFRCVTPKKTAGRD